MGKPAIRKGYSNRGTPLERVLRRVVHADHGHLTPCWVFTGRCNQGGYGLVNLVRADGSRTTLRPHRVTYEHFVGPIPAGHEIDHLCEVKRCVNPDHLEAVTPDENTRRFHERHPEWDGHRNIKRPALPAATTIALHKPNLRASVNAVRANGHTAAKVGCGRLHSSLVGQKGQRNHV